MKKMLLILVIALMAHAAEAADFVSEKDGKYGWHFYYDTTLQKKPAPFAPEHDTIMFRVPNCIYHRDADIECATRLSAARKIANARAAVLEKQMRAAIAASK